MRTKFTVVFIIFLFIADLSFAQMKAVIMGSSTANGVGASSYANSWAGRTTDFLNSNNTDGADTIIYNIAQPGYDTYQEMPDNFVPPPGRPLPDGDYNVTKALSYNPDVIIISLPSNDISYGYAKSEMINNLRLMSSTIFGAGVRCYITTPQPRNDFDQSYRDSLRAMVDSVNASFGPYAVDFWNCLVTTDGLNMLKPELQATGSSIHVNDDGHNLLFGRIMDSYIFGTAGPVALQLTAFNAQLQNNKVIIKWHTEQQAANTSFELQKSADGSSFETFYTQTITEARPSYNYTATDQTPFSGKNFYRLKISEAGRLFYSGIVSVTSEGHSLNISKLYLSNGGSSLNAAIDIQKTQFIYINIVSNTGAVLLQQKKLIAQPLQNISIPVGTLATGQYYLQIITDDGNRITKAFVK